MLFLKREKKGYYILYNSVQFVQCVHRKSVNMKSHTCKSHLIRSNLNTISITMYILPEFFHYIIAPNRAVHNYTNEIYVQMNVVT